MPISEIFQSMHRKKFEVNFSQIMPNGFLKLSELLNFLQLTAAEHSELGGISFVDMQVHHQAWVLSKMRLEIQSLPKWKDEVTVETWIVSLENSRSLCALKILVGDEVFATCETFWVVLNTKKRKPESLALPHAHFEKYENLFVNSNRISPFNSLENSDFVSQKKVCFSDLDMVNHVNHIQYLQWCLDCLPTDILLKNKIKSIEMYFIAELLLDDVVVILENRQENLCRFTIQKDEKTCFGTNIEF